MTRQHETEPLHVDQRYEGDEEKVLAYGRLADEVRELLQVGDQPNVRKLAEKYPELAHEVSELVPALSMLDEIACEQPNSAGDASMNGTMLGDYRIVREVGRGGMGVVYEAWQVSLERRVALKVLPFAGILDQRQLKRFKNEAHAAAGLHHQNIVPVFAVGSDRSVHFYAMQYVEGQTLDRVIDDLRERSDANLSATNNGRSTDLSAVKSAALHDIQQSGRVHGSSELPDETARAGGLTTTKDSHCGATRSPLTARSNREAIYFRTVAELGVQVAEAIHHAHCEGVIHRDIKPSNLILDADGKIWVTDFGLAYRGDQPGLTMTGDLVGTLRYMSPEQALAKRVAVDDRTDIYSLGVTLYEMLALRPAYAGKDRQELLRQIAFDEPRPVGKVNRSVPRELETIISRAMAKNPAERYPTAQELADDLKRFLEHRPIHARRPTLVQRVAKWSRRHRPMVASGAIATTIVLLAVAIGGAVIAEKERGVAEKERDARLEAETLLVGSIIEQAQSLCEQGEIGRGLLWYARGLQKLPERAVDLQHVIRCNLTAWSRELHSLNAMLQHTSPVVTVAVDRDGVRILTACADNTVQLWDALSGRQLGPTLRLNDFNLAFPSQAGQIQVVTFSPDGAHFATGHNDGTAQIWSTRQMKPTGEPLQHATSTTGSDWMSNVKIVAFSQDGSRLATASGDSYSRGAVRLWDLDTHESLGTPFQHGDPRALVFTATGLRAVVSVHSQHQAWDVERELPVGPAIHRRRALAAAISPDGTIFATAGNGSEIELWNAGTGAQCGPPIVHGGVVSAVTFSQDGSRLLSGGNTRTSLLWDTATREQVGTPLRQQGLVRCLAITADGGGVLAGSHDGSVRIWNVAEDNTRGRSIQHQHELLATTFSSNGLVTLTRNDGWARLESTTSGEAMGVPFEAAGAGEMQISNDSSRLLLNHRGTIELIDIAKGRRIGSVGSKIHGAVFSPDGSRILIGHQDGRAEVRDARTLEPIAELLDQAEPGIFKGMSAISCVAFSPDGSRMLTGSYDGTTRLWNAETLASIGEPLVHASEVKALAYSPDSTRILIGFADGTVRLWDATALTPLGAPLHHSEIVCSVAFNPDGSQFLTCSLDQTARLWDTSTLKPIGPVFRPDTFWNRAYFGPDGREFLLSDSAVTQLWSTPPGPLSGDSEQIGLWCQIITGLVQDSTGGISSLSAPAWHKLHRQLEQRGGPPPQLL